MPDILNYFMPETKTLRGQKRSAAQRRLIAQSNKPGFRAVQTAGRDQLLSGKG
jgi:hypothetical protein